VHFAEKEKIFIQPIDTVGEWCYIGFNDLKGGAENEPDLINKNR